MLVLLPIGADEERIYSTRHSVEDLTCSRAISIEFFDARLAANEQYVTELITAVSIIVAFHFRANLAIRNYFVTNPLPKTLIKYKILT